MFDAVRNNKKIVQVFLALIALPFAFFGVESYVRSVGTGDDLAKVGDSKVTRQQFEQAQREQQERLSGRLGKVDPKIFDTPEARKAILGDLIDQRLIALEVDKQRLIIPDAVLGRQIAAMPAFQVDGKFSKERYESQLRGAGMNPQGFEAQMRRDIALQQLAGSVTRSGVVSRTVIDRIMALQTQTREVQESRLSLESFLDKVALADGAVQKFYEENGRQFEIPEQAKVEYAVLGKADVAALVTVPEEEIKAWYDGHKDRYEQAETRQASHILLTGEKGGERDKLRAEADRLLQDIRKNPKSFAELAKKYSQDPGSAAKGGDLGYFGRGAMVKPFEEAAFAMKEGEISNVIESDFGLHIIKLTSVRPAKVKPLAEVRGEIEPQLREAAIGRKFAELAESFTNLVYEQSDSLKPAAEKFKIAIKQSDWIGRHGSPAAGPLANDKVLAALFSEDSVKNRRNTEAVEIAPNTLLAARIVDYKAATRQPLEAVKGGIESLLKRQEAQKLAVKEGEAMLARLKGGEDKAAWGGAKRVSRLDAKQIDPAAVGAVFKVDAGKLPGYAGVEMPAGGYTLYKVGKVSDGEPLDAARRQPMQQQLLSLAAQEEFQSYLAALRARYKVEINNAALEAK